MPRTAVRIAVMLLADVAGATVCGAASSRASQTTSTPTAGKKYISKRYGYSIVLKGKYLWFPAHQQWDGRFPFGDTGQIDATAGVYIDHKFAVAAKPVPPEMTLSEWKAFVMGGAKTVLLRVANFPGLVSWRRTGTRVR